MSCLLSLDPLLRFPLLLFSFPFYLSFSFVSLSFPPRPFSFPLFPFLFTLLYLFLSPLLCLLPLSPCLVPSLFLHLFPLSLSPSPLVPLRFLSPNREVGDRRALQMAKYHAEMFYSVVGVLEDMAATYRVLRHYLPRFFMRSFRTEIVTGNQRHNAHETASTPTVLNATKALMKSFLKEDYELYYFLRQRLHLQEQTYLSLLLPSFSLSCFPSSLSSSPSPASPPPSPLLPLLLPLLSLSCFPSPSPPLPLLVSILHLPSPPSSAFPPPSPPLPLLLPLLLLLSSPLLLSILPSPPLPLLLSLLPLLPLSPLLPLLLSLSAYCFCHSHLEDRSPSGPETYRRE
ncbi:Heparan sulfate 2-O-sulfotransferase [Penaeus vannamei]|uniref:Heparan sulfate 2-O-sulfotransferase n=1 Tax=Penaeus vannamei TaxID=6689 RepID=A0A423STF3_PENVA|nr:Heparan sulfate 2-O-sulfotransferase [Penaeus vannamei]